MDILEMLSVYEEKTGIAIRLELWYDGSGAIINEEEEAIGSFGSSLEMENLLLNLTLS